MQRQATAMSQFASMNGTDNLSMDGPKNSSAQDNRGEDQKQDLTRPQVQDSGGLLETDRLRSWDAAARQHVQQHYQGQVKSQQQQQQQQGEILQAMRGSCMPTVDNVGMSNMDMNLNNQQQMNQQMSRQQQMMLLQQMQTMMGGGMGNGGMFNC